MVLDKGILWEFSLAFLLDFLGVGMFFFACLAVTDGNVKYTMLNVLFLFSLPRYFNQRCACQSTLFSGEQVTSRIFRRNRRTEKNSA